MMFLDAEVPDVFHPGAVVLTALEDDDLVGGGEVRHITLHIHLRLLAALADCLPTSSGITLTQSFAEMNGCTVACPWTSSGSSCSIARMNKVRSGSRGSAAKAKHAPKTLMNTLLVSRSTPAVC
jgi:hypothetical protein